MVAVVFTPEIQMKIRGIVYAREVETGVTLVGRREGAVFSVTDACGPDPVAPDGTCYSGDDYASFVYGGSVERRPGVGAPGDAPYAPSPDAPPVQRGPRDHKGGFEGI